MNERIWLKDETWLAGLAPGPARLLLGLLGLLLALCLSAIAAPAPPPSHNDKAHVAEDRADFILYEHIIQGLREGRPYYPLAADSLRRGSYPLKPFVTFRLPTLAVAQASLPAFLPMPLMFGLAAAVLLVWYRRLGGMLEGQRPLAIASILLICGLAVVARPSMLAFHEAWGGLLIALSLGCRTDEKWRAAVIVGLAAMLIRETAALYVMTMAGLAMLERRPREMFAWGGALCAFALAVAAHAHAVAQVVLPEDPASPGWSGMLGLGFLLNVLRDTTSLAQMPHAPALIIVGLTLFGWAVAPGRLAQRTRATIAAYGLLIALFCRADTFYWGLMIAPFFLVGLIFVPDAVRDLIAAARLRPATA